MRHRRQPTTIIATGAISVHRSEPPSCRSTGPPTTATSSCPINISSRCPRFARTANGPHKDVIMTHPCQVFYLFKKHAQESLGYLFDPEGYRLLLLAILDEHTRYLVHLNLKKEWGASCDWDRIEDIFLSHNQSALSRLQDIENIEPMTHLKSRETFREFVERYRTILQIYRIQDDEHRVLGYLSKTFQEQLVYLTGWLLTKECLLHNHLFPATVCQLVEGVTLIVKDTNECPIDPDNDSGSQSESTGQGRSDITIANRRKRRNRNRRNRVRSF